MKRITVTFNGLIDLPEPRVLAYCINIAKNEWISMTNDDALKYWSIIKDYIQNGFDDTGINIPESMAEAWKRSKHFIDLEAKQ